MPSAEFTLSSWNSFLPDFMFRSIGGLELAQWAGLLVAVFLAYGLGLVLSIISRGLLHRVVSFTKWTWDDVLSERVGAPLHVFFAAVAYWLLVLPLQLPPVAQRRVDVLTKLMVFVGIGWMAIRLIDVAAETMRQHFTGRRDDFALALIPVFQKVLRPVVAVLMTLVALQNLGVNVAGLLAGLGIGGIAVALAGKPTLENIFGSIAIAFDRPFRIGDTVKTGDVFGTVEDVGLRSTRIRTQDRTLISIPNGTLSTLQIENFAARDRFRLWTTFGLKGDTTLDQIQLVIDEMKRHLVAHPRVFQEQIVVRYVGVSQGVVQIELMCWLLTNEWYAFTGLREELLLEFRTLFARCGATSAFPTQTIDWAPPGAAADVRPELAEASRLIAERKAAGELSIPEVPQTLRERLRGETVSDRQAG